MIKYFVILSFLIHISFNCLFAQNNQKGCVKILYVNQYITTPFSINCESYEELFSGQFQTVNICNAKEVKLLKLSTIKKNPTKQNFSINVKIKIYFFDIKNRLKFLCIDNGGNAQVDGVRVILPKSIKRQIFSKCHYEYN